MKKILTHHKFFFVFIFSLFVFNYSFATDYYWTGNTSNSYSTLSNWNTGSYSSSTHPSVLPTSSDNLFIGGASSSNFTVDLNIADTIAALTIEGTGQVFINSSNSKVLNVTTDLTNNNSNSTGGGSSLIRFISNNDQTWSGDASTSGIGKMPNVNVQKNGGTLSLSGFISMGGSSILSIASTNSGTIDAGHSTLVFTYGNIIRGDWVFNDVEFVGRNGAYTISYGSIVVNGNMLLSDAGIVTIDSSQIELHSDLDNENGNSSSVIHSKILLVGDNDQMEKTVNVTPIFLFKLTPCC